MTISPLGATTNTPPCDCSDGRKRWRIGTLTYTAGGLAVLFGWLLWGDFAWQMRERSVAPVVTVMLQQYQSSALVISLLLASLPAALSVIIGPVVSYRSDRHRGPRGRRIPFLLVSTPFAAFSLFLMAATPWLGGHLHAALGVNSPGESTCVLLMIGLMWTVFECSAIIGNTLFGALINDVVPKEMIGRFFGLFRACSLLAGIVFNKTLFAHADEHYAAIFVGLGVLFGLGFTLMCLRVKEGEYPPPPPPDTSRPPGFVTACREYFRECCQHRYFLFIFLAQSLATICFLPINLYSVPYADSLGMPRQTFGDAITLTYLISLGLAYFLGWMADKFHPLRMGIVALGLYAAVMVWGGIAASDPEHFKVALIAHGVLSGVFLPRPHLWARACFPTRALHSLILPPFWSPRFYRSCSR